MVQETIKAVKEAEAKAEKIIESANEQAAAAIEQAKKDAVSLKEAEAQKSRQNAASVMEAAKAESERELGTYDSETDSEITVLKQTAAQKEGEAIRTVIADLY